MAKKATKAAGKKSMNAKAAKGAKKVKASSAKVAKRAPGKPSSKPASKPASAGAKLVGMHPVSTGGGLSPMEIGMAVVAHLNSGAQSDDPLWDKFWSPDFASIEGMGTNLAWHGRKAVKDKCEQWVSENQIHGCRATGPFVGSTGFCVHIEMDVTEKKSGQRKTMREVGVYTVQGGKVVREEFMYGM